MEVLPPAAQRYVYYRVAPSQAAEAIAAARAFQHELHARYPTLHCRLLQRAVEPAENFAASVTLMETYVQEGGIDPSQWEDIEALAHERLGPLLQGARHVEVFEPCA